MIERKLNSGRSILEMLGVLAIVAVITLNGLGLIRFLINYAEAYSTIKSANETAVELRIRQGRGYLVENYWMFNANITKWDGEHGEQRVLTLAMRNTTPEDLCKVILRQAKRNTEIIHVEPANCTPDNNQVIFYFAFDEGTYHSPFTGNEDTDRNDPLSGGCLGKSIQNGKCTYDDGDCILRKDVGDSCGSGSVCLPEGTDLVCRECPEELPEDVCKAWDGCDDLDDKADGVSCGGNFQCQSGECVCLLVCDGGQVKNEGDCSCECPKSRPKWDETALECVACPSLTPYWNGSKCVTCFEYNSQYPYWNGTECVECPASTPKWNGTECVECPASTPKWNGLMCVACPSSTPYWNGTDCVEDPCSLEDSSWTATEPDVSRTNYLANAAIFCELDPEGAFTLEQLQVGTTGDGTACYCNGGYYTYFEGGCASGTKSCRECPWGFGYYVDGNAFDEGKDNVYSAAFSCETGKSWYDAYNGGALVSCAGPIREHASNSPYECQYKWEFCDLSGEPMMMGFYCFSCDDFSVEYVMSTADIDLVNETCGWSGEDAYVYSGNGTWSCATVKADIGSFYGAFYADSGVCKTVRYNVDEWCFGWDCTDCTLRYGSGDEYCQYVGNTCGLNLEWSEDKGGCVCPDNTPKWNGSECVTCFEYDSQYPYWNGSECVTCFEYDSQYPYWNGTECVECPASTPKWNGTECVECPASTPKWNGSECVTCLEYDSQYPYWNGTECVDEDPCSLIDSSWTATEPDISRTNYLGNVASACEVDPVEGAFTLEQLQVGTTGKGMACYCGDYYYTYFENGCASDAKSCRECPSGFSSGYGVVEGSEVEQYYDNQYSVPFSCGIGKWWYDGYNDGDLISCDVGPIDIHGSTNPYECQLKWDFCDFSGTPMMMGGYCFSCDDSYVEYAMSTADTDLFNATCGLSGENAYVYESTGGYGGTHSCAQVKAYIESSGSFNPGSVESSVEQGVCKTVRYNDDDWCFGWDCTNCTSTYESADEYCQYVGNTCGLDLEWSEDKGGCV